MSKHLIPSAKAPEDKVFYNKMFVASHSLPFVPFALTFSLNGL